MTTRFHEDELHWKEEKQDLNNKLHQLYIALDKTKRESQAQLAAYKQKYLDYKAKVKQANQQINNLAGRLVGQDGNDESP